MRPSILSPASRLKDPTYPIYLVIGPSWPRPEGDKMSEAAACHQLVGTSLADFGNSTRCCCRTHVQSGTNRQKDDWPAIAARSYGQEAQASARLDASRFAKPSQVVIKVSCVLTTNCSLIVTTGRL